MRICDTDMGCCKPDFGQADGGGWIASSGGTAM